MKLTWDSQQPLPVTSQALLEQVWQQTILSSPTSAAENEAAASALAQTISDREELWIPRAIVTDVHMAVERLLALGILARDSTGMKLGFSHQTLYEFARARSFVRTESLTEHVLALQGSLFVRPTIWMALHYLRAADTARYQKELHGLWEQVTRRHIRLLLIEFIAQCEDPDAFERRLLAPVFDDPNYARAAFNATMQTPSWLRILLVGKLPDAMAGSLAPMTYGAVVALLKLERDRTLLLMRQVWGSNANHAGLAIGVLRQLDDWTLAARDLLADALSLVPHADELVDSFAWKLKAATPTYAIDVAAGHLKRKFAAQEPILPASPPLAAHAPFQEQLRWAADREPKRTLKALFDGTSRIHFLMDLADAAPGHFLRSFLPWVESVVTPATEMQSLRSSYRIDYLCDCSRADHTDRGLPHALRSAGERLAQQEPDAFRALCSEWARSDLHSIHAILSYGLESLAASNPGVVVEYLLGDARRFCLGESDADGARTIALLESIRTSVSPSDVPRLEFAIRDSFRYSESAARDARARAFAMNANREHRLRLFQCLPPLLLTPQTCAQIEQEVRVFGPHGRAPSRPSGFRAIGSPMSSAQMDLAADEHILGLFDELADGTRFHPKRFMEGGAVEAAGEFASLAKRNPQRAIALISRFQAGKNETPVATALDALAGTPLSGAQLFEIIAACHQRGFASEYFRTEAARSLGKRAGSDEGIPEAAIALLQEWLARVPRASRSVPRPQSGENSGSPPFLYGTGGVTLTAIPGGSYAFLDTLLIAYLSATPPRIAEWLSTLFAHLERDEDPLIWRAFARRLVHLARGGRADAGLLVTALFSRYPEVLESGAGMVLAAHASWWVEANILQRWATFEKASGNTARAPRASSPRFWRCASRRWTGPSSGSMKSRHKERLATRRSESRMG